MGSIAERMLAFVAWHGEIPSEAERLEDARARQHDAVWMRRLVGGWSTSHVAGFALGDCWWVMLFDRRDESFTPDGAELWNVELYGSDARSWADTYLYWPAENRWRHVLFASLGEEYGRPKKAR